MKPITSLSSSSSSSSFSSFISDSDCFFSSVLRLLLLLLLSLVVRDDRAANIRSLRFSNSFAFSVCTSRSCMDAMKDKGSVSVGTGTTGFAPLDEEDVVFVEVVGVEEERLLSLFRCRLDLDDFSNGRLVSLRRRFDGDDGDDDDGKVSSTLLPFSVCRIIARGEPFQ